MVFGPKLEMPPFEPQPLYTSITSHGRSTLTILRDGKVVLGFAEEMDQQEVLDYVEAIKKWLAEGTAICLPFTVDVDDQREVPA